MLKIDSELQCQTVCPDFVIVGFPGLPPSTTIEKIRAKFSKSLILPAGYNGVSRAGDMLTGGVDPYPHPRRATMTSCSRRGTACPATEKASVRAAHTVAHSVAVRLDARNLSYKYYFYSKASFTPPPPPVSPPPPEQTMDQDSHESARATRRRRARTQLTSLSAVVRPLSFHQSEPRSIPGAVASLFWHVGIVSDDAAGRRIFSGISRLPLPFISAPLYTNLSSPTLALKMSMLRAVQISSHHFSLGMKFLSDWLQTAAKNDLFAGLPDNEVVFVVELNNFLYYTDPYPRASEKWRTLNEQRRTVHAGRRQHCTSVHSFVRSDDEAHDARDSVVFMVPMLLRPKHENDLKSGDGTTCYNDNSSGTRRQNGITGQHNVETLLTNQQIRTYFPAGSPANREFFVARSSQSATRLVPTASHSQSAYEFAHSKRIATPFYFRLLTYSGSDTSIVQGMFFFALAVLSSIRSVNLTNCKRGK
ncbi:hypothetical protein PR048_017852 [Dryococelus australis]|uniref:Uncharacterized protein n=1 Tax=Dryococelus australis TaxID=614101 RepID=A0ABQ9HAM8_9NEOP|nr:hypothetical protein PR048_017852 [Dryococelus australis]